MFKIIGVVSLLSSLINGGNILLFGDSMAEGLSTPLKSNNKGYRVTSLYKRGSTIPYWNGNKNLFKTLNSKKWDIVLVSLGTNDLLLKQKNAEKYIQFNEKLSTLKAKVYWIIPPPMPFKNEWMEQWIKNPTPPIEKIDCQIDFERVKDGVHLTQKSYKDWGKCVMDTLP